MPFAVIPPPAEINALLNNGMSLPAAVEAAGAQLAEIAKPMAAAAESLGIKLDIPGFLYAWINGTRVLVEKDASGTIVGMAFLAVGKKWVSHDDSATILEMRGGDRAGMVEFAKSIAGAVGARYLYLEEQSGQRPDGTLEFLVLGYPTG